MTALHHRDESPGAFARPHCGARSAGPEAHDVRPPFSVAVSRALGTVVVSVHGRLDTANAPALHRLLEDLIDGQGNLALVVNAGDMAVGGAAPLAVLAEAVGSAASRGGVLLIADPPPSTLAVLEAAGLGSVIVSSPLTARGGSLPAESERS